MRRGVEALFFLDRVIKSLYKELYITLVLHERERCATHRGYGDEVLGVYQRYAKC